MKNLQMALKAKWFEMTKSGIKTEDYREITPYWIKRLAKQWNFLNDDLTLWEQGNEMFKPIDFTQNTMTLGYPKSDDKEHILILEHKGIEIRTGNPDWGAEPDKLYFVIKHGVVL